jgi:hypothetical protein
MELRTRHRCAGTRGIPSRHGHFTNAGASRGATHPLARRIDTAMARPRSGVTFKWRCREEPETIRDLNSYR